MLSIHLVACCVGRASKGQRRRALTPMPTPIAGPLLRDHPIHPSYLREREHTVYVALALGGSDF